MLLCGREEDWKLIRIILALQFPGTTCPKYVTYTLCKHCDNTLLNEISPSIYSLTYNLYSTRRQRECEVNYSKHKSDTTIKRDWKY